VLILLIIAGLHPHPGPPKNAARTNLDLAIAGEPPEKELADQHHATLTEMMRLLDKRRAAPDQQFVLSRYRFANGVPIQDRVNVTLVGLHDGESTFLLRVPGKDRVSSVVWCTKWTPESNLADACERTLPYRVPGDDGARSSVRQTEFFTGFAPADQSLTTVKRPMWKTVQSDVGAGFDNVDVSTMRTIEDPRTAAAFIERALDCIACYTTSNADGRTTIWHGFLSIPKRNLRTLKGAASTAQRNLFQRGQLILGDIRAHFEQTVVVTRDAPAGGTATSEDASDEPVSDADKSVMERWAEKLLDFKAMKRACTQFDQGFVGKAAGTLQSFTGDSAQQDRDVMVQNLIKLHPEGNTPPAFSAAERAACSKIPEPSFADVQTAVRDGMRGAAPGPTGWTEELLDLVLNSGDHRADNFKTMVYDAMTNNVHPSVAARLRNACLIGIPKSNGGTRPIAMGEMLTKIASRIAIKRSEPDLRRIFGNLQLGVAVKGG